MSEHHIVSPKIYFAIFAALMVCTGLTVWAAEVDLNHIFSGMNVVVALAIATFKAALVVLFFMHGKYSSKRTQMVIICSVFWLAVMLFMTMSDYLTRAWS
ncbi:MAG TPA: cytochrome C oxidase subunit IV family protein [Candidatus Eisenbacteria bacterium]|nr:cytochrome C oxidase subunit IV family protein [Candidatus Eisenbacteria bacterium]